MLLLETGLMYLLIGCGVAVAVYIRGDSDGTSRLWQTLSAIPFWPLFVPLLLDARTNQHALTESRPEAAAECDELAIPISRVESELDVALSGLDGWAENVLASEQRRLRELRSAWKTQAERIRELDRLLATTEAAGDSLTSVSAGNERVRHSEEVRQANLLQLRMLRQKMHADLVGTLAWVRELVTLIHLAKFSGAPASRAEQLVAQIAAAVEGLSEASAWRDEQSALPV